VPEGYAESAAISVGSHATWYAVHTRHQHEKTVALALASKGFEVFLPLYAAPHRWKDRTKVVSLPLFPGYAFFKGDPSRRLQVLTTPGIHSIVSYAGQLAAIPANEIEDLRRVIESGAPAEPHPFLTRGDRVRVKGGPFAGVEGILVRKRNLYRLVLSIEMLGKAAAVEVDACLIDRVSGSGPHSVNRSAVPVPAIRESSSGLAN